MRLWLWHQSQTSFKIRHRLREQVSLLPIVAIPLLSLIAAYVTDRAVAGFLTPTVLGDVLIGSATLIGSFLTAAFALSVSLQQSVADLYSPQYLPGYSFGYFQRFSFVVIAILILSCLSFGVYIKTLIPIEPFDLVRMIGLALGFLAIGVSLGVLGWQLQYGGDALNPISAIDFLRKKSMHQLKVLQKTVAKVAHGNDVMFGQRRGKVVVYGPVLTARRRQ